MEPGGGDPRGMVADVMRLLYSRGLVSVRGGNVSVVDRGSGLVYISPSGMPRHLIGPRDVAVIRLDGSVVEGMPSSEWRMHVEIYRRIPGAAAVVHAHGSMAVAAAEAGVALRVGVLNEASYSLGGCGEVPVAPRVQPGTWELARAVAGVLESSGCRGAVMRGHGMVAYGETVYHALDAVEAIEELARVELALAALTGRRPL
ncbi:MAG: class II aldolase/adducin family protein [Desulfurococcales archaeon]|nr:class II aldolase/adducin family protein [Desulfurococcales archaeon]